MPDRLVLNGILHVLHTGIAWEDLPQEYGYGSGVTAWRRLRDWQPPASGTRCIRSCWPSSTPPGRSIGRARRSTAAMCVPFWGAPDGAVPGRSFPHRLKAPSPGRRDRHPAGRRADRRQPPRRHPAHPAAGRPRRATGGRQDRPATPASPTGCWPTAAMTSPSTAGCCGRAASSPSSPSAASRTAPASGASAGSSSAASRTCTTSAACGSATNAAPSYIPHYSCSPARSSAGAASSHCERPSKPRSTDRVRVGVREPLGR